MAIEEVELMYKHLNMGTRLKEDETEYGKQKRVKIESKVGMK